MTKLKNSKCDKTQNVTKLKNSKFAVVSLKRCFDLPVAHGQLISAWEAHPCIHLGQGVPASTGTRHGHHSANTGWRYDDVLRFPAQRVVQPTPKLCVPWATLITSSTVLILLSMTCFWQGIGALARSQSPADLRHVNYALVIRCC